MGANGTTAEFSKIMEKTPGTPIMPRSTGEPELIPLFAEDSSIKDELKASGEFPGACDRAKLLDWNTCRSLKPVEYCLDLCALSALTIIELTASDSGE